MASHHTTLASPSPLPRANLRAKRALDLTLGLLALAVTGPVLLMIWVAYKLSGLVIRDDRGPVFRRVCRNAQGRMIHLYKVRIAKLDALAARLAQMQGEKAAGASRQLGDAEPRQGKGDPYCRVEDSGLDQTCFGCLIKAMYLDELPQVWNIVRGDMSFVGPRPLPLRDKRCCPDQDGLVALGGERFDYRHRDMLPGGLTGLYQANKSAAAKIDYRSFMREGVALDRQYYEWLLDATPWQVIKTDLSIMCRTIPVVLRHEGI